MNTSHPKYVIPTKGPIQFPRGAGLVIGPVVGLLIWCLGVWAYRTFAPAFWAWLA